MWQSSNTIRIGQMLHIALCCLEGSMPEDGKRFIPVYRLGEDGDLL